MDSILVSAGFQPNATQQDYRASDPLDQHALKSLKVVTELKFKKRITCSTVLNLETGRRPAQRGSCARMPLGPSKMDQNKSEGFLIFFFLISVQTKLWLQSLEFVLMKEKEIADNVHQGPLSVDFDNEWFCA
jgi:hypothetical protein